MADLIIDDVVKVYNESGKDNGSMIIDGGGLQCRRISYENIFGESISHNSYRGNIKGAQYSTGQDSETGIYYRQIRIPFPINLQNGKCNVVLEKGTGDIPVDPNMISDNKIIFFKNCDVINLLVKKSGGNFEGVVNNIGSTISLLKNNMIYNQPLNSETLALDKEYFIELIEYSNNEFGEQWDIFIIAYI